MNARDWFPNRFTSSSFPAIEAAHEERAVMFSRFYLLLLLAVSCAFGQTISGVIQDAQGASIPGASVELVARDNTARTDTVSDSSGRYRFENVAPGAYLVEASASGFAVSAPRHVSIDNNDQQLNFQLAVAAVQTGVVVTASGTAQTADELSKSVSTVDASFIQRSDEASISDALRFTSGLRVEQQGGPGGLVSIK